MVELMSTSESEEDVSSKDVEKDEPSTSNVDCDAVVTPKTRRKSIIITERLISALDKCKISDRSTIDPDSIKNRNKRSTGSLTNECSE